MTSIDLHQTRGFRWKKFATEGAGRLIIFMVGAVVLVVVLILAVVAAGKN